MDAWSRTWQTNRGLRVGVVIALAAYLIGSLGALPADASRWVPVPGDEFDTDNPCTGQPTTVTLHDVELLVSGHGDGHEGLKFRGRFTTGDGFTGTFRDQDQWNVVPGADDVVATRVVMFRGSDDAKRRVVFTSVAHVVVRDDTVVVEFELGGGRCVGRPLDAG